MKEDETGHKLSKQNKINSSQFEFIELSFIKLKFVIFKVLLNSQNPIIKTLLLHFETFYFVKFH
jgi:hypothetical protein